MDIDKILGIAKFRPVQPSDVSKALNVDSILAGAILSDLSSKKMLKVSSLKSGSSPFYYIPGNEAQLLNFLNYLNPKDKDTVDLLKEKKVIRTSTESPLVRVSLRNIKDFAVPLEVTLDNRKELFYKWFLVKDDEAAVLIKGIVEKKVIEKQAPTPTVKKEKVEPKQEIKTVKPELKKIETKKEKVVVQKNLVKKEPVNINYFFQKNNISVVEIIKKRGKEIEQIILLPTPVGKVRFYCKFLAKARITDADISNVLVNAQLRKLPGLLLYSGELNNKANDLKNKVSEIIIKKV